MQHLLPPAAPHDYIKRIGATAFAKLGHSAAVAFVYSWKLFGLRSGNETYYFREVLSLLRSAHPDFQKSLAEHAAIGLGSPSRTPAHAKTVFVLAYLGDERLVEHLAARLGDNQLLAKYENHALLALGTEAAGELFMRSVLAVGKQLAMLPNDHANNDARYELIRLIQFTGQDLRYLYTPAFESYLLSLIENDNPDVSWIARNIVNRGLVESLLYPAAVASSKRNTWIEPHRFAERCVVTAGVWLDWWEQTGDISVKRKLLDLTPLYPSVEVEEVLLKCLESNDLRAHAIGRLREYGSVRSAPLLREILVEERTDVSTRDKKEAAFALGDLCDDAAIRLLKDLVLTDPNTDAAYYAVHSLGFIGTPEAERAMFELLEGGANEDTIVQGLITCGSPSAMAAVMARAKARPDGPEWLWAQISHLSHVRGWTRGEFYTHVSTQELADYLDAACQEGSQDQNWDISWALQQIDSPDVRRVLRKWADRRGTHDDPVLREEDHLRISHLCVDDLMVRGDEYVIPHVLDYRPDLDDDYYVQRASSDLRHFPSPAVADELRHRLSTADSNSRRVRLLSLLGRFGNATDADLIRPFLDHPDDMVANVACEALLRLTDPLLVPEGWREI